MSGRVKAHLITISTHSTGGEKNDHVLNVQQIHESIIDVNCHGFCSYIV